MLTLSEIYNKSKQDEITIIKRMETSGVDKIQNNADKAMLWYINQALALGELFLNFNINAAKQHFYRCGLIDEYLIKYHDSRILDSGISNITYSILSDSTELISRYMHLEHSVYDWMVKSGHSTLIYCIQQVVLQNWEQVEWSIAIMESKNPKQRKIIQPDLRFFHSLLENNRSEMIQAINELLLNHKKRNKYLGVSEPYISIPALTYTKLAWLSGYDIEIEHKLVPKSLLAVSPLTKYDPKYKFLNET